MDLQSLKVAILNDEEDEVINYLASLSDDLDSLLSEEVYDGLPIIHFICKDGRPSTVILQICLDNGAQVNQRSSEGTPIQIVSRYGHAKYIHTLLDNGACMETPEEPVYHQNSPFYVASMYGHSEVVRQLYLYQPSMSCACIAAPLELVKSDEVRTCLLYAACLGGKKEIIKQWYCPNMNINNPPYYSTDGFNMNKTPLYAACSGGHTEIVKYLVRELEAELTGVVCEQFPDIIEQLFDDCYEVIDVHSDDLLEQEEEWVKGDYSRKELGGFHESWIHPYTVTLVELDLSHNNIKVLPDNVPWSLPNLKQLSATHNCLTKFTVDSLQPVLCLKLEKISLEHNKIEELCDEVFQLGQLKELQLSHNQLKYLVKTHQQQEDWRQMSCKKDSSKSEWKCTKLQKLYVSHNVLEMLPPDIRTCIGLIVLDASHNKLATIPSPWECKMTLMDLSHNVLVRFPPSVEQYWCGTLKVLKIHHNQLEEIGESVFKLCVMTELDASHNSILPLPSAEVWDCKHLNILDLSSNKLGIHFPLPVQTSKGIKSKIFKRQSKTAALEESAANIVFPAFLAHCLQELNLSDNYLDGVPPTVCDLNSLQFLDLSDNPGIKRLPKALGKLSSCKNLKLDGCDDKMLQEIRLPMQSPSAGSYKERENFSKDIIQRLRNEYRCSKPYYRMKLVILGKKDKGKTTLSGLLGAKVKNEINNVGIRCSEVTLNVQKRKGSGLSGLLTAGDSMSPPVTFCVWDLAGDDGYAATHHCFFTPNSLYLLVWDIWSLSQEIDKLGKLLYSIEASTPNSKVILAATFLDKSTSSQRQQNVEKIKQDLLERFSSSSEQYGSMCSQLTSKCIIPVSCTTNEGISELKRTLYDVAISMKDLATKSPILGRMIPLSYTKVQQQVLEETKARDKLGWPPLLHETEFQNFVSSIEGSDVNVNEELSTLVNFLQETGSILHFNDQLKGLNNMYFLDPTWLCDVLSKVLFDPNVKVNIKNGKIPLDVVEKVYLGDSSFPNELIEQAIQLLERFEIGLKVDAGKKLFIPSTLAKNPGIELHHQQHPGKEVCRLYQMAFIPNGFWSRLLPRIMSQLEMLSEDWIFRNSSTVKTVQQQIRNRTIYRMPSSSRSQGLKIEKKNIIYWEDGMCLLPQDKERGYFMLQTVSITRVGFNTSGVLITVHATDEDYSIMGMIVDAIDDLLNDHFPGLMDYDPISGQPRIQRYAVCPVCYTSLSSLSVLPETLDHFTVEHCARLLLSTDSIVCRKGVKVPLHQLVPELLMEELPKKFLLEKENLQVFQEAFLGRGVSGSVFKGKYGDNVVAVKFYHGAPNVGSTGKTPTNSSKDSSYYTEETVEKKPVSVEKNTTDKDVEDRRSIDSDDLTDYKNVDTFSRSFDLDEASSIKAWRAFMEMRQEVAVTSKLQHPCVVSFVGISVRPQLLMCLELAPLGSLRDVLDSQIEGREPFNKYRDQEKIFLPVFVKDLIYKMVWQIAKGLDYLHKHGILYRDLKSDNILVNSLELEAAVNIKLSDLGISKFHTSGGAVGLVGTPGYQAPEIIDGTAYDEKVDIFSFSMVIHEILSGERPYVEYKNLAQISRAMRVESKRPSLKDYNIDARFPALEDLMVRCWQKEASRRPKASEIVSQEHLRSIQFVCQHKQFSPPDAIQHEDIACAAPIAEFDTQTKQIWLWEGVNDSRCYHVIDLTTCRYQVYKEWLPGAAVTCMSKIGKEVWVGNENEEIEIFGQPSIGNPTKLKKIDKLGATPTSILYLEEDCKGMKKVYVSLSNSRLRIYIPSEERGQGTFMSSSKPTLEWYSSKSLHLSRKEEPASCMVFIPEKEELWIGCGREIVLVNDKTEMVEQRIDVRFVNKFITHPKSPSVLELVYGDGRVWVLLKNSSVILEFDAEMGILTHILNCDEQNPLGMVISNYISMKDGQPEISRDSSDSGESLDDRELAKWITGSQNEDEISKVELSPPPDSGDVLKPSKLPPEVPPRRDSMFKDTNVKKRINSFGEFPQPSAVPENVLSPPLPPKTKLRRSILLNPGNSSRNSDPLPPKIPPKRNEWMTLPPSSSRSGLPDICAVNTVNTIICVGNSLWLGRSCGDIVVVNIQTSSSGVGEHGRVVACMKPEHHRQSKESQTEVETLLLLGCLVISIIKKDSKYSEIAAWEAYDGKNILQIQGYWSIKQDKRIDYQKENTDEKVFNIGNI